MKEHFKDFVENEARESPERYVIWSEEHGGWWIAGGCGYTRRLVDAGRFSHEEALGIEAQANMFSKDLMEVAIVDPVAQMGADPAGPETLGDCRDLIAAMVGEENEGVRLMDQKIKAAPGGRAELIKDAQMRQILIPLLISML
jgi:hypothetical protein